jgi:two-component system sensor histidine kinase HydH
LQSPEPSHNHKLLEDLSAMTVKTYKELELTKQVLNEKELQLMDLATLANQKINESARANRELKGKVEFLQEITTSLNEKNQYLERINLELETQKAHYNQLSNKLRKDLANIAEREKSLEIQRNRLAMEVEEKTRDLIKTEKMASVGQLSSRLVHDLRNPLSVVKSTVELLKLGSKNMDEKTAQKFQRIETALKKISYQIEDVLDFVRQSELHLKRQSVSDIINSTITGMDLPKDVKIKLNLQNVVVNCDSRKLEAVFSNIITNASQAMNGKGEIKIKVVEDEEDALIKIEDTGPGMTKSVMEKIFEPLFTTKDTGTGLGLSICKSIVEQHGGEIEVSSPPTVFTIRLPKNLRGYYKASDSQSD